MKRVWGGIVAIGGAIGVFLSQSWEYLPAGLQGWWRLGPAIALVVPLLLVGTLTAISAHYRYNDLTTYNLRQAEKAPPLQRQRIDLMTKMDYGVIATIQTGIDAKAFVMAREPTYATANVLTRDVAVIGQTGEARMKVAVLFQRSSWVKDSDRLFENGTANQQPIDDALRMEPIAEAVKNSREVYCFGLSSSEPSDDNDGLSVRRGQRLCQSLAEIGYLDVERQRVFSLPLGTAVDEAKNEDAARLQRVAIIVGIEDTYRDMRLKRYVEAITIAAKPSNVRLDRYARKSATPDFALEQLMWIRNDGVRSYSWRRYSAEMEHTGHHGWWEREAKE